MVRSTTATLRTVVVGSGRAGGSFHRALSERGWHTEVVHHASLGSPEDPLTGPDGSDVELVLLCVPDSAVAATSESLRPRAGRLVAHCAGSLGLDVLATHDSVASVHPLVPLPDATTGAQRLSGAWFAVAGDTRIRRVVDALEGTPVEVPDAHRASYHAAAAVASNHLVALLDEVRRLAATAGVPLRAYLDLVRATVDNVAALGPAAALTGPVAREDWPTVISHLGSMDPGEHAEYLAGVMSVAALAGVAVPPEVSAIAGEQRPDGGG